jgi:hypothetical protein
MVRTFSLMLVTAAVLGLAGCQCFSHRPAATQTAVLPGKPYCPPGGAPLPPPPAPVVGGPSVRVIAPPPTFPGPGGPPPTITPVPPGATPSPAPAPSVTPVQPGVSQFSPRLEPNWQPAEARGDAPRVAQGNNDPLLGTPPGNAIPKQLPAGPTAPSAPSTPRLYPPEVQEKTTGEPPLLDDKTPSVAQPKVNEQKPTTSLPAGIAQFVPAIAGVPQVSAGLRPSIDDGLDWLAKQGYKTVVHLRAPGEAAAADRTQVEKLGLTYVSLEVSPLTLTRETLEQFEKLVGEVAGALWYLYFRKVSGDSDEQAQIRAERLGLRPNGDEPHRRMWLAAQKYLQDNP